MAKGCKQLCSKFLSYMKVTIYNKETKEILGRRPKGWAQLGLFYFLFYIAIGSFFAAHLAIFVGITPSPAPGVKPWNFGRYAYPNYPNAKIGMIAIPAVVDSNGTYATYRNEHRETILSLVQSASVSGVECMNVTGDYGFANNRACVLIRLTKVFDWTPESLEPFLSSDISIGSFLDVSCSIEERYSNLGIQMNVSQGIPLSLNNNPSGRSFPFENQDNYSIPLAGVALSFSNISLENNFQTFDVQVTCGVDRDSLGLGNLSESDLSRVYEIPHDTSFLVHFVNSRL